MSHKSSALDDMGILDKALVSEGYVWDQMLRKMSL